MQMSNYRSYRPKYIMTRELEHAFFPNEKQKTHPSSPLTNMIKPPPYSSTEPSHTVVPIQSDVKAHPTPSGSFLRTSQQQEVERQTSLQNLEHQTISYQHHAREGGATEQDVERVAQAMDNVANNHVDPKIKAQWKRNAKIFRKADQKEHHEGVIIGILKGFLILLTSPFYIVGATLHATGVLLDGIGFALKSIGQLMKKLTYTGGSSKPSSASVNTTSNT